jgi:tetratricopeptide (TPR) repeat protein
MVEANRPPPSAEELAALNEAFRRDPARSFVYLGDALLALGRAREAVDVGARGLKIDPDNLAGRVMVARAFALLHQWKEAQAELLKVVKADRNHGAGFRMLGEVLMRRADYERALPVLQHAQNLDPADPATLALLRRARAGQALDPPPPVPTPMEPGMAAPRGQQRGGYHQEEPSNLPTRVAGEVDTRSGPTMPGDPALARMRLDRMEVQRDGGRRAPVEGSVRHGDDRGVEGRDRRPVEVFQPPPTEDVFAPIGQNPVRESMGRGGRASQPPPLHQTMPPMNQTIPPGVRPRVMPIEKPRDAAQASLRASAAVGEHYLNNLLVAGLLEVPRVRVPEGNYDLAAGRRWGRSTVRMFIYLFVLLFMAGGGVGGWYWYAAKQRGEDVARHIAGAEGLIGSGDHDSLRRADEETRAALERDRDNPYAVALMAHITALEAMLYGEIDTSEVANAIDLASQDIKAPGDQGYRELVLARAAHTFATLATAGEGGETRVADARKLLETWLEANADDGLARWLLGHALLAAGDRKGAAVAFEQADKGGEGPVLATIALAELRLDDGKHEEAKALFDRALERAPKHGWAFVGRSLTRSERSVEMAEAVADLNVGVATAQGPRIEAFKHLALATAQLGQEDYKAFAAEVDKATGLSEPRFLARLALLRVAQGKLDKAAEARTEIRWYADKPQPDPLVVALDAELRLASGAAREAFTTVENEEGLRAARLRGRALFDMGQAEKARAELDEALAIAPKDLELSVWAEAARMVASSGDERRKADETLDSLGRQAKSKAARVVHGIALASVGRRADARSKLEASLKDITEEYPNPLAYRAHVILAEIDLAEGKPDAAIEQVKKGLELNNGYLPAHDLLGRLLVDRLPDEARAHLVEVVNAGVATAEAELAFARLAAAAGTPEDKKVAADAVRRAKEKGATPEQLAAVIPLVDVALFGELGVVEPKAAPPPKKSRRRGR